MFQQDWLMLLSILGYMQQSTLLERREARKKHVWPIKDSACDVLFSPKNRFLSIPVQPLVPGSQQNISSGCSLARSAHIQAYEPNRFVLNLNRKLIVHEPTTCDWISLGSIWKWEQKVWKLWHSVNSGRCGQFGSENRECVFYSRKLQTKKIQSMGWAHAVLRAILYTCNPPHH